MRGEFMTAIVIAMIWGLRGCTNKQFGVRSLSFRLRRCQSCLRRMAALNAWINVMEEANVLAPP